MARFAHAIRKWKAKLFHRGVLLGHGNRLTYIRYADDLMLFATSSNDLIYMLETLIPEFAACGLQLNSAKTKILTASPLDTCEFVDVFGELAQVIHAESVHKCLGRRLQVAWNKFHKYKHILLNKHISLVLRLKIFDAVVSPAMLVGLATLPLTKVCLQKLGVVQRRMLRSIFGWVRIHDDQNWRDILAHMNHRMAVANILFSMADWEDRLFGSNFRLAHLGICARRSEEHTHIVFSKICTVALPKKIANSMYGIPCFFAFVDLKILVVVFFPPHHFPVSVCGSDCFTGQLHVQPVYLRQRVNF